MKCNVYEKLKPIVLGLGTFHTLDTLFSVIGKRFRLHACLKDLVIEAGVVAEKLRVCSSGGPKLQQGCS